jgi:hypothetical protein
MKQGGEYGSAIAWPGGNVAKRELDGAGGGILLLEMELEVILKSDGSYFQKLNSNGSSL